MVTSVAALAPEYAPILARVVARLLEQTPDALFDAGKKAQLGVAAAYDARGVRSSDIVAFEAKWPDGAAFVDALRQGALEAVEVALWILERMDRRQAVDDALALFVLPRPKWALPAPTSPDYRRTVNEEGRWFAVLVQQRAQQVASRNADLVPPSGLLDMDERGGLLLSHAREPLDRNPALDDVTALAETTASALSRRQGSDFSRYLLERLRQRAPEKARGILEPLFQKLPPNDGEWSAVARALYALGSTLPRDVLAAAVREGRISDEAAFPRILLDHAVWAVFDADPKGTYDVLAPYLDQAPPSWSGHALSITDAVLLVLQRDHEGKVSAGGYGGASRGFFANEPRWAALFAKKAEKDVLWERAAWLFEPPLPLAESMARLAKWERRRRAAEKKRAKGLS
jgi:hypothetical protein